MRILIACEKSGIVRDAFAALGHDSWSCDTQPSERPGNHLQCDVLTILNRRWDAMIAHPECTYLTNSAAWAYKDGPYHMRVKPGTLVGAARRRARADAVDFVFRLRDSGIPKIAFENPVGHLSAAWRKPDQTIQPYEFGDNASKATCLWLIGFPKLIIDPAKRYPGRWVTDPHTGKLVERWENQTDGGQNRLPPSADRSARRSKTYIGIARAMAEQWGGRI